MLEALSGQIANITYGIATLIGLALTIYGVRRHRSTSSVKKEITVKEKASDPVKTVCNTATIAPPAYVLTDSARQAILNGEAISTNTPHLSAKAAEMSGYADAFNIVNAANELNGADEVSSAVKEIIEKVTL